MGKFTNIRKTAEKALFFQKPVCHENGRRKHTNE